MKLFQYWDSPDPPAEVARWTDDFRTRNPDFEHVLFDRESASVFIADHYDARHVAAFRACAVPAMQADYIRLCALDVYGGVWVDADNQSLKPLSELIAQAPHGLMFTWFGLVNNGFLWFREAGNLFLRACLALSTENVEARRFKTEFTSTGPGVFNAIRVLLDPGSLPEVIDAFDNEMMKHWDFPTLLEIARTSVTVTPELREAYRSVTLINALAAGPWIGAEQPDYKKTERHWLNWTAPIYREDA